MNLCFLTDNFTAESPAQQLLDRFLIGYPRNGTFHKPITKQVSIHTRFKHSKDTEALRQRQTDFNLKRNETLQETIKTADTIVIVPRGQGASPNERLIHQTLSLANPGSRCFVYGSLALSLTTASELTRLASKRNISLAAGTAMPVTWRLPQVDVKPRTPLKEALIVVQGGYRIALLEGLEGILPLTERRPNGPGSVRNTRVFTGRKFWDAADQRVWSPSLFAAALSRSNSPLGDPEKDGRTQDLVRLKLVPELAQAPRARVIDFEDGFKTSILQLDGVVADCNFAVGTADGKIVSAQIYRPPPPASHEFSRLAETIEQFLITGTAPWPIRRSLLIAELMERFAP